MWHCSRSNLRLTKNPLKHSLSVGKKKIQQKYNILWINTINHYRLPSVPSFLMRNVSQTKCWQFSITSPNRVIKTLAQSESYISCSVIRCETAVINQWPLYKNNDRPLTTTLCHKCHNIKDEAVHKVILMFMKFFICLCCYFQINFSYLYTLRSSMHFGKCVFFFLFLCEIC